MQEKLLVVHGGGPTPVINASLFGAIQEAHAQDMALWGARAGVDGILKGEYVDLTALDEKIKKQLLHTPASALGTSRTHLEEQDYETIIDRLVENQFTALLFNGGNGSMDTCGKIYHKAKAKGIHVIGIPKTIDNDIAVTDHSPGFGSAARYLAGSVHEVGEDVKSMPIHVVVIETMGRNAGWITASSVLARKEKGDAPHLILLPEVPFDEQVFLQKVKELHDEKGGVVVVASEGILHKDGKPVVAPLLQKGRDVYFGDVSSYLSTLIMSELGIKSRGEKPGILGRASIAWQSSVDVEEAVAVGRSAVQAVVEGKTGYMVSLERTNNQPYTYKTTLVPIEQVMLSEKKMPAEFIAECGFDVTQAFIDYTKPLIGGELPEFTKV